MMLLVWLAPHPALAAPAPDACATGTAVLEDQLARLRQLDRAPAGLPIVSTLGGLVVMQDNGDLTHDNAGSIWDLEDSTLTLTRVSDATFDATRTQPAAVDDDWGDLIASWGSETEVAELDLPFSFPFGTAAQHRLYIHSTFDITFLPVPPETYRQWQYIQNDLREVSYERIAPLARPEAWIHADVVDLYARIDADRVTLTWYEQSTRDDWNPSLPRRVQVVLDASGTIAMSYPDSPSFGTFGAVQVQTALAPPDVEDISAIGETATLVTGVSEAFTLPGLSLDVVQDLIKRLYGLNNGNLDAIAIYQTFYTDVVFYAGAFHTNGTSGAEGIGQTDGDQPRTSLLHMNQIDLGWNHHDQGSMDAVLHHELGHRWLFFVAGVGKMNADVHPCMGAHLPAAAPWWSPDDASAMGGTRWTDLGGGRFATPPLPTYYGYSWLELYLMGLAAPSEVLPFWHVEGPEELAQPYFPPPGTEWEGERINWVIADIVNANGPRVPAWPDTQRQFDVAVVLVSRPANPADQPALENIRDKMRFWPDDWHAAVDRRAVVRVELPAIVGQGARDCDFDAVPDDGPDGDGDLVDDVCDRCEGYDDSMDEDGDLVPNACDRCPGQEDHLDADRDGAPDACDRCEGSDDALDGDGDQTPDGCEACPGFDDAVDPDEDGIPDGCDLCPLGADHLDADGDGVPNACDACAGNPDDADADADGVADGCDACPGSDDRADVDGDELADGCDPCPAGHQEVDGDRDGVPDACDLCLHGPDDRDDDDDGVPDACDGCADGDDADDADSDGTPDACDLCPGADDRADGDENGVPDDCEPAGPATPSGDDGGCGCATGSGRAPWALALLGLAGTVVRRRGRAGAIG